MDDSEKSWRTVEPAAHEIFRVWMDDGELEWAREAWDHLHHAGLVGGSTPFEQTATSLRLLTLGLIFHDFCRINWDRDTDQSIADMVEGLEIHPIILGIYAGSPDDEHFELIDDEDELFEAAVENATALLRKDIHQTLITAYGDDEQLCARLHATCADSVEDDEDAESRSEASSAALKFVRRGFKM